MYTDKNLIYFWKCQEGRMRGQAFVTFPSVELAHHALVCIVPWFWIIIARFLNNEDFWIASIIRDIYLPSKKNFSICFIFPACKTRKVICSMSLQSLVAESSEWLCIQRKAHDHPVWPESFSYETKLNRSSDR